MVFVFYVIGLGISYSQVAMQKGQGSPVGKPWPE